MKTNRKKIDAVMLAVALFCVSGACLAYNLHTSEGGESSVSLSDLMYGDQQSEVSALSAITAANITARGTIPASAEPSEPLRTYELLPPIVVPPA